jgi:hypothetical protein
MTTILPSPFLSAGQHPLPTETAAAAVASPPAAAAGPIPDPPSNEGRHQGASTDDDWNPEPVDATDHIHEIFHHARKLMDHRFVLDEQAFMDAIEPPPLFLQRAV